jgi:hypothetical protein
LLAAGAAVMGLSPGAAAEPRWGPVDLTTGAHAGVVFDDVCRREASDLVGCTPMAFVGLDLGSHYHLRETWALGLLASFASAGVDDQDRRTLWSAALEGRVTPLHGPRARFHLSLDAGVVAAVDRLAAGELGGAETTRAWAPAFGVASSVEWTVGSVRVGPTARGFVVLFDGDPSSFDRAPSYPTSLGALLALRLSVSPG